MLRVRISMSVVYASGPCWECAFDEGGASSPGWLDESDQRIAEGTVRLGTGGQLFRWKRHAGVISRLHRPLLLGLRTLAPQSAKVWNRPIAEVTAFPDRCMVHATPHRNGWFIATEFLHPWMFMDASS